MPITVERVSPALGAEIKGVDLSKPMDEETVREVYRAWLEHQVICFRGQDVSEEDHIRFGNAMGKVGMYMRPSNLKTTAQNNADYSAAVMLITNIRENGEPIGALPDGEMMWHTDTTYDNNPHKATTLYSIEIPDHGGETLFSDMYGAYEALPEATKKLLEGRGAYNAFEFGTTIKTKEKYDSPDAKGAVHPAVLRHPETGRLALYVNELMTEEIVGLPPEESRRLLDELFEMQRQPQFIYEHVWRPKDMIMWDNRCTLHARKDFPSDQRRLMRRITIESDAILRAA
jgi:taurine dioxygenase